jgi:hypothetical protein
MNIAAIKIGAAAAIVAANRIGLSRDKLQVLKPKRLKDVGQSHHKPLKTMIHPFHETVLDLHFLSRLNAALPQSGATNHDRQSPGSGQPWHHFATCHD